MTMGFLDFLKKGKKADAPLAETPGDFPPPPGADAPLGNDLPPPPGDLPPLEEKHDVDIDAVEKKIGLDKSTEWDKPPELDASTPAKDAHPENPVPTASMMANPIKRDDVDQKEFGGDEDFESIPVPPPSMQDPDFLTAAADDFAPKEEDKADDLLEHKMPPALPTEHEPPESHEEFMPKHEPKPEPKHEEPPKKEPKEHHAIDLPDFTDEDIASLDAPAPEVREEPPEPKQKHELQRPEPPKEHKMPEVRKEPPRTEPPTELAVPEKEDDVPPFEAHPAFHGLKPAMFLSSEIYFELQNDVKETRKLLRDSDEIIKDTTFDHEKGDDQLERLAAEMNTIQERFMQLDSALFEE